MARGSIGKRGSKYIIRYRDDTGKQHWETIGTNKHEAETRLRKILGTIDTGTFTAEKIGFSDLVSRFLESKKPDVDVKVRTAEFYANACRHLVEYFGKTPVDKLRTTHIKDYKDAKITEGKLSARSIGYHLGVVGQILDVGIAEDYLTRNVARFVKRPKAKKHKPVILTGEEMSRLLAAASGQTRMILEVCLNTGMRASEICGLKWDNVDLVESIITVEQTYSQGRWDTPKTDDSERRIELGPVLVDLLAKWKENSTTETVFANSAGNPISWTNFLKRDYKPLLKSLDLPPATPHSLRHTHISALVKAGEELIYIQHQAGHADLNVTLGTYTHLLPSKDPEAGKRKEAAIKQYLDS